MPGRPKIEHPRQTRSVRVPVELVGLDLTAIVREAEAAIPIVLEAQALRLEGHDDAVGSMEHRAVERLGRHIFGQVKDLVGGE